MEDGLAILRHAVRMIFHDIWATLRITVGPVALAVVLTTAVVMLAMPLDPVLGPRSDQYDPAAMGFALVILIIVFVCITWMAVAWHRYVLLGEQPGAVLPRWNGAQVWSYFVAGLKLALVVVALAFPVLFALGLVSAPAAGSSGLLIVFAALLQVVLTVCFLRFGLILPAAALGRPLRLGESWEATRGTLPALVTVALALLAVQVINQVVPREGMVAAIAAILLSWFSVTLSLSVLTTLYGTRIEARALT